MQVVRQADKETGLQGEGNREPERQRQDRPDRETGLGEWAASVVAAGGPGSPLRPKVNGLCFLSSKLVRIRQGVDF